LTLASSPVFAELGVLIIVLIAASTDLEAYKVALIGLLAVATVLLQDTTNTYVQFNNFVGGRGGFVFGQTNMDRVRVAIAGSALLSIVK
jgi:hypothetical protein